MKNDLSEKSSSVESESRPLPEPRFDIGVEHVRLRQKWWQLWLPLSPPPPPPKYLTDAPVLPVANASFLSLMTFSWLTDMMILGYRRTLQPTDLWKVDESRESGALSTLLDEAWERRVLEAEEWNMRLKRGEIEPSAPLRFKWMALAAIYKQTRAEMEDRWRDKGGMKHANLAWALNDVFGREFWVSGIFKVVADTSQLMGPLLVKAIINFAKERAQASQLGKPSPNLGRGVGMAIGLFGVTFLGFACHSQFFWRSMSIGVLARGALISSIYKRGINLTHKSRARFPNSLIINHVSTDVNRINVAAQWFHTTWTTPIQVLVCLAILLVQLGPSALAGFAIFVALTPIQNWVMALQLRFRRKSDKYSDARAKTIMEVLSSMRIVKYFCYEDPFLERLSNLRKNEVKWISRMNYMRSANLASAFATPSLAATLALVAYTSSPNEFDVAVIFASLTLFALLRQPMVFFPRGLSSISDAQSALHRLTPLFHAELFKKQGVTIEEQDEALVVNDATFEWESSTKEAAPKEKGSETTLHGGVPFQVSGVSLVVPCGQLLGITGVVGSGKSSLLQGLIGEMRLTKGRVSFGGNVAYCPQTAWIQNVSLKDNILFGASLDEKRYQAAIMAACLLPDLLVLPSGDLTEIGEKGVNLSGGQKQRVSIARALYADANIVILDDPLSAVDAHVAQELFFGAILGLKKSGKTVLLVTHALHFIRHCDYVCVMGGGKLVEQGTYQELVSNDGEFARLDREFAGEGDGFNRLHSKSSVDTLVGGGKDERDTSEKAEDRQRKGKLIMEEKRLTGGVSWQVYATYFRAGYGWITIPLIILAATIMQGGQILFTYTIIWWQHNTFQRSNSFYQMLYAILGVGQALFIFVLGFFMDTMSTFASQNLHNESMQNIFRASMSFFDTTPLGRIVGVFGKDIDIIDNLLTVSTRLFALTVSSAIGSVVIVAIVLPYFLIVAFVVGFGYVSLSYFYRASALEIKRLEGMFRSILYSHLSESMTGLSTIRAFGEIPWFIRNNQYYIDLENRAQCLLVTNQLWLTVRLDFMGCAMVFCIAVLCAVGVSGISAAQSGLVLTYMMTLTQASGLVTRQHAEVESHMNAVERITAYSIGDVVVKEAHRFKPAHQPPPTWPDKGAIQFNDVVMKYRPGLPNVLHGISLDIRGGEKIGIVGRTGAGKSTLTLVLLRIVELTSGSIVIDGIDVSTLGLHDLRSKISVIPQEPVMFGGSIRSNLDPFSQYDDKQLWDALHRSCLSSSPLSSGDSLKELTLDSQVEAEGANISLGQRSLLSLARALVKEAKIVIMDEATASVDLETDSKIQRTIQTEFSDRTLLCIAHRLRTILSYDRILVLDEGRVAEFDTPLNLFDQNGIFTSMCAKSSITRKDIEFTPSSSCHNTN